MIDGKANVLEHELTWQTGKLAKIQMGFEPDHGVFGTFLQFDFGSTFQGYGWHCLAAHLDTLNKIDTGWNDRVLARNFKKILELHEFLGVAEIQQAKGMYLEVGRDPAGGWGAFIIALRRFEVDGGAMFAWQDGFDMHEED
jgi:hypothetical protein